MENGWCHVSLKVMETAGEAMMLLAMRMSLALGAPMALIRVTWIVAETLVGIRLRSIAQTCRSVLWI